MRTQSTGVKLIAKERARQIEEKGMSADYFDKIRIGYLVGVAPALSLLPR